ncbi:16S rRNA (guanine(527)-N(7))-methyltransferase RsmG [Halalkalibacillus sediminis]|uniref:Ribosomal RNA small subunit methyltransferase G n=1 Tax=Halalkalibacillus sediminis TaxID=2018042 RepID=A0A2I0QSW8_9BACI|nr:16S rRNA (guanine(527)-N(7))-methyltransferase RsmG [Halalkalibacillus sediminis]PKR77432.1 16S rRNA (guanine(527)-N(7))-methyltransferase RsmG [Halalkalibacillus sediminis]
MDIQEFEKHLNQHNISLSDHQKEQFNNYYELLVEWNQKMNLTAITEKEEVYLKHFYDSVSVAFYYDFNKELSVCDVGAGAGFPSIPLKILFPHIHVTIVDSLKKRITFLNHLADQLGLSGVAFYHDRAENFGKDQKFRETFDMVISRAVARTSVLSELCLPLVRVGGDFIMMKSANFEEEKKNGELAVQTLGGEFSETHSFNLPVEESERNIVIVEKRRKTSKKYPRKAGLPNKEPIEP